METATFKISGMHCVSCCLNIDGVLEEMDGVIEARTSYAISETKIKYNSDVVAIGEVITTIATLGYSATLWELQPT